MARSPRNGNHFSSYKIMANTINNHTYKVDGVRVATLIMPPLMKDHPSWETIFLSDLTVVSQERDYCTCVCVYPLFCCVPKFLT